MEGEEEEEHSKTVKYHQKYRTFYIGIAKVVLPYIGPWEN